MSGRLSGFVVVVMVLKIVVLVVVTWFESLRKRIGAPAALGIPYVREERV